MLNLTIEQKDFERALPAGQFCTGEVFKRVAPSINQAVEDICVNILGEKGEEWAKESERNEQHVVKLAVLMGFLNVFRQLDLVLTPTGFGVVANDTTAPASKSRVDELQEQLRMELIEKRGKLLDQLTLCQGWGSQPVAKEAMPYLYYETPFCYLNTQAKSADWAAAKPIISEVDQELRAKISDEQMDDLMLKLRTNGFKEYPEMQVRSYMTNAYLHACRNNQKVYLSSVRHIIRVLEDNPSIFPLYHNSEAYQVNHFKHYENAKSDPSFFFLG